MVWRVGIITALFVLSTIGPAVAAKAVDPRAWPTAYEPTDMTASKLLAKAREAAGRVPDGVTVRETYEFQSRGMAGSEREIYRGGDYRSDSQWGPFVSADGRYKGQRWEQGDNGYTLYKRGIHQKSATNVRLIERAQDADGLTVAGRLRAPADVYVLRVNPVGGRNELRFYDAATFRLIRREAAYPRALIVDSYEDFRTQGGVTRAYRVVETDGHPENDDVTTLRELRFDQPATDAELAVPSTRRVVVNFPAGSTTVRLPARIDQWGRVIVRVVINGRGLDFQLDSGAGEIVIDRTVAEQLGLKVYGRWRETVAGTFTAARAIVPKMEVGALTMDDVVVSALPFTSENDSTTKVVGLLGFDFLAGGIMKIDYQNGTVDAMPYDAKIPADAMEVDAALDDGVPMIAMRVNGILGEHFIMDTGADQVTIFSGFAGQHPQILKDHSPGNFVSREYSGMSMEGVGGALRGRPLALEQMQIGTVAFRDFFTFVLEGGQSAFEDEDIDGLVGASVLSAFDVYLDYANSRVCLALNRAARQHRPARGLGAGAR